MVRQEEIAKAAYELFEQSGCVHGRDEVNWLEAEKKILSASKPVKRRRTATKVRAASAPKKRRSAKSL